jgi:hypothetical protein
MNNYIHWIYFSQHLIVCIVALDVMGPFEDAELYLLSSGSIFLATLHGAWGRLVYTSARIFDSCTSNIYGYKDAMIPVQDSLIRGCRWYHPMEHKALQSP